GTLLIVRMRDGIVDASILYIGAVSNAVAGIDALLSFAVIDHVDEIKAFPGQAAARSETEGAVAVRAVADGAGDGRDDLHGVRRMQCAESRRGDQVCDRGSGGRRSLEKTAAGVAKGRADGACVAALEVLRMHVSRIFCCEKW